MYALRQRDHCRTVFDQETVYRNPAHMSEIRRQNFLESRPFSRNLFQLSVNETVLIEQWCSALQGPAISNLRLAVWRAIQASQRRSVESAMRIARLAETSSRGKAFARFGETTGCHGVITAPARYVRDRHKLFECPILNRCNRDVLAKHLFDKSVENQTSTSTRSILVQFECVGHMMQCFKNGCRRVTSCATTVPEIGRP